RRVGAAGNGRSELKTLSRTDRRAGRTNLDPNPGINRHGEGGKRICLDAAGGHDQEGRGLRNRRRRSVESIQSEGTESGDRGGDSRDVASVRSLAGGALGRRDGGGRNRRLFADLPEH